jgi:hypothetical protein
MWKGGLNEGLTQEGTLMRGKEERKEYKEKKRK